MRFRLGLVSALLLGFLLSACTGFWQSMGGAGSRQGVSSSLVDFLYPRGETPRMQESTPHLQLPLRVGLAFVPGQANQVLPEQRKVELLNQVKAAFEAREFISRIEVIPDTYLRSGKGFETVDQVARLYGLDVMALVSYDQMVYAEDTAASILYWTIVGAYVIKGSRNDVRTFVDTAVFDVKSRELLFRAPGVDHFEAKSTLIGSIETIRKAREEGFDHAMADMTGNLQKSLDDFVERVKQEKVAEVSYRQGYSGGGGASGGGLLLLLVIPLLRRRLKPV